MYVLGRVIAELEEINKTEFDKDKYKRKIKYIKNLFIIEDSTDIYFTD